MPQAYQGNATNNPQTSASVEMGGGRGEPDAASRQPLSGGTIAPRESRSWKSRNKQSLDYVLRTGLAGGLAGCAVSTPQLSNSKEADN